LEACAALSCTSFFFGRKKIIVASFTYIAGSGPVPVTFDFTDTSTGNPTKWIWNFGDGQSSDLQHPSHTYTVAGIFTVSLTAYIPSGSSFVWPSPQTALHKWGSGSSNAAAHAAFQAASWSNADPYEWNSYFLDKFSASSYEYYSRKITYELNLTAQSGRILLMVIRYDSSGTTPGSGAKIDLGGVFRVLPDWTRLVVADISSLAGGVVSYEINDMTNLALLPEPVTGNASGWSEGYIRIESYGVSEGDSTSKDINVAVDWCGLGWIIISKDIEVISPTERNFVIETDKPVHLVAKYMLERPNKTVKWRVKYGMPYRCYPHYDLSLKGSIDQLEPSDTIIHTFPLQNFPPTPTLNLMLSGTQCNAVVASRSPLIEVNSVFV
jgi:PKD repeat protein